MLARQHKRELWQLLGVQLLVAGSVVLGFRYLINATAALSAGYGAAISILPTWLFAGILFRYQGASKAQKIVRQLYLGEGIKLFVSAGMFGVVIALTKPCWWVLFVSFIVTQLGLALASLLGAVDNSRRIP